MAIVGCMQQDEIWDLDAAQHYDTPGGWPQINQIGAIGCSII